MGFPFKAVPFVCLLGLFVAMASVPEFFTVMSDRYGDQSSSLNSWLDGALVLLADIASSVAGWFASPLVVDNLAMITQFALLTIACLLPAALLRSIRAASWMPAALTASGFVAGLVAIPLTIWLVIVAWYIVRIGLWLFAVANNVMQWLLSVLEWLAPVILVLAAIMIVVGAIYWLIQTTGLSRAIAAGALILVLVVWLTDVFDPVLDFLLMLIEWFGIAVIAVTLFFIGVFVFVFFLGVIVAVFGSIGRVSVLSITGAWEASRGAQKVTDLSAGVGLTVGFIVLAAAMQGGPGEFGPWLEQVWLSTPVVGFVPPPVDLMDWLVPSMAEGVLANLFAGFTAAIDIMLLVLVGLLGVLSLTLRSVPWSNFDGQRFRVAFPVLVAVGLGLAFALPMLLLTAATEGD
jgi:hypothetical protein